jgi:hypothetical protein
MKSALIVTLLTILRLGIPTLTMLGISEIIHHHENKNQKRRGA